MKDIKVRKDELLGILETNRTRHREVFEKALDGFRKAAVAKFEEQIERIKAGKRVDAYAHVSCPRDQTPEYDRAISMLKMSTEDVVVLSELDFKQLVQDDWAWKEQWKTSNKSFYAASYVGENASLPEGYRDDEDVEAARP